VGPRDPKRTRPPAAVHSRGRTGVRSASRPNEALQRNPARGSTVFRHRRAPGPLNLDVRHLYIYSADVYPALKNTTSAMTKTARTLLAKLDFGPIKQHRKIRKSTDKCISEFLDHLHWLKSRHIKKNHSDGYLVSTCFEKPRVLKNDAEVNAYCRVHLAVAIKSLENLIKQIRGNNGKINHTSLRKYSEAIRDYLFDLRPLVEHLERRKDPSYEFFSGGKNYSVHTWELFRLSRQLAIQSAYRKEPFHVDHKTSQIASIFVLRQALEAKFERIIAVALYDSLGQTPKLRHGFHYDFINANPAYFEFTSVHFSLLKKLYDWCNVVVHRAFQPYAWQIDYAHSISSGLFASGNLNKNGGWSIHGGVRIHDLSAMQSAFIAKFCKEYDHGIWCVETSTPEAVTDYYA
jgi:hypothetical protein